MSGKYRIEYSGSAYYMISCGNYRTGTRQVLSQTDAAGHTTTYAYHPNAVAGAGQIKSVTNALLKKSYYAYDLLGRQIRTWGATDYPQQYGYNAYGELVTLTTWRDAANAIDFSTATWPNPAAGTGDTTTWTYHSATGLLTRKEYADTKGTNYAYDSANRLSVRTWARSDGLDTTYGYDSNTGELLSVDYENANTPDITYTYDRVGRQATVADATGSRSFAYDATTLRLNAETLDTTFYGGTKLKRAYQDGSETNGLAGRSAGYELGTAADADAYQQVDYTFDTSGRLKTVAADTDTFSYGYEANTNRLASLTAPQHTVAYTYETNRDLMTAIDNRISGSSYSNYAYSHDALGRRTSREQSGSAFALTHTDTFAYNTRSEVTGSTNSVLTGSAYTPTYTYDKIGNRESSTGISPVSAYTANQLSQYTAIGATNPTYDADGNLTSNGTWTYTWNGENRLRTATKGTTTINFTYDYLGRLVKKDDGTNTQVYVYDGWTKRDSAEMVQAVLAPEGLSERVPSGRERSNRIATFNLQSSTLTLQTTYFWGLDLSGTLQGAGGVGGLLKEGVNYPLYDANGNIVQKLNGTGTAVMNVDYDPFGNIIRGTLTGEYGFSTKPLIDGIDWYYYGFRYYDPVTGRWPSRDPIEERGGLNLYGFVKNDAIDRIDSLGLAWGNARAVWHYYWGEGEEVPLSRTGHVGTVTDSIKSNMDKWKKEAEDAAHKKGKELSCPAGGSETIKDDDNDGAHSGVWWIGGISLKRSYECDITADCSKCEYTFQCSLTHEMDDRFVYPLDLDNDKEDFYDDWTLGGTPFYVTHTWSDSTSDSGALK